MARQSITESLSATPTTKGMAPRRVLDDTAPLGSKVTSAAKAALKGVPDRRHGGESQSLNPHCRAPSDFKADGPYSPFVS